MAEGAARALLAIAGLLERAAEGAPDAAAAIDRMRGEVASLEDLAPVDLDRADRVKAALERGVEALRAIARARAGSALVEWVEGAAAAVSAVDPAMPLRLAHAPVQDALRALADAVITVEARAPRSGPNAAGHGGAAPPGAAWPAAGAARGTSARPGRPL